MFLVSIQAGHSALHIAARVGNAECVRCLLLSGADTDLLNKVQFMIAIPDLVRAGIIHGFRVVLCADVFLLFHTFR